MKSAARSLAARGFAVFPCAPFSKVPASEKGFRDAVTDGVGIERLWGKRRWLNIGIATGQPSSVFVIDVDDSEGAAALAAMERAHGSLPGTLTSITYSGHHLFFTWPGRRVSTSQGKLGPKIDVRGDGGCCMVPPSIHPTKTRYRWRDEGAPIVPAPDWLVALVTREPRHSASSSLRSSDPGPWAKRDVETMLACLSPDLPREEWLRVGMALHSASFPFEMWDAWSQPGKTYDAYGIVYQWKSFKNAPGGVSMGTLVRMAKLAGWKRREAALAS